MTKYVTDVLLAAAAACTITAGSLVHPALGFLSAGACFAGLAAALAYGKKKTDAA